MAYGNRWHFRWCVLAGRGVSDAIFTDHVMLVLSFVAGLRCLGTVVRVAKCRVKPAPFKSGRLMVGKPIGRQAGEPNSKTVLVSRIRSDMVPVTSSGTQR